MKMSATHYEYQALTSHDQLCESFRQHDRLVIVGRTIRHMENSLNRGPGDRSVVAPSHDSTAALCAGHTRGFTTVVTRPLHDRDTAVTRQLHDHYETVTRPLHNSYTTFAPRLHNGYTAVTQIFSCSYTTFTRESRNGYTTTTQGLHVSYTTVTPRLHDRHLHDGCTTAAPQLHNGYTADPQPLRDSYTTVTQRFRCSARRVHNERLHNSYKTDCYTAAARRFARRLHNGTTYTVTGQPLHERLHRSYTTNGYMTAMEITHKMTITYFSPGKAAVGGENRSRGRDGGGPTT